MELFISAGEASSDIHCARLVGELKKLPQFQNLKTFGLGGDHLIAQGLVPYLHCSEFSVGGGPLEVIGKIPKRRKLERLLEQRLYENRPNGAVLVDNGEINLRLASLLHFFEVPVVYFIPPKVWAWRFSRIEKIAQHVNLVLSILPFEDPIYKEWEIPSLYVGNPLVDEVPIHLSPEEAKRRIGIDPAQPVLTVMPGSRHTEIARHVEIFSEAVGLFFKKLPSEYPKPQIVVPTAPTIDPIALREALEKKLPGVHCVRSMSHESLRAARAALVKSGTSTLEAALLGTPMILAYQVSKSAAWIFRNIARYKGYVGLVNLFLSDSVEDALGWGERAPPEPVVPELILEKCTPEALANALLEIYVDGDKRNSMLSRLSKTKEKLMPPHELGESPLRAAALASAKVFS